ncbi:hypothetical protein FQN57_000035 [Myotisia sp. PD_48]|nr:hypothetical protein FQN57_000035 [Myotisia sp. PD_48]
MADPLYELLVPYFDASDASLRPPPPTSSPTTARYLNRLSTLSIASLKSTELQSLSQSAHSNLVSLQALANRSHKVFITSADNLHTFQTSIPKLFEGTQRLRDAIPQLDEETIRFSSTYSKGAENEVLGRRKKALQLARNVDRLSDILELPAILSTAVSSSSSSAEPGGGGSGMVSPSITGSSTAGSSSSTNYSSALDLFAHIKRLQTLYPDSPIVKDIARQADEAMKDMTTNLISELRVQNIRLAPAMRIIGWLRRIAPELELQSSSGSIVKNASEGAFGALFLICRLANLLTMLNALEPLRDLADQETQRRRQQNEKQPSFNAKNGSKNRWLGGQQTERFLKRYIEIYREQSFAIVSLYKNIFPSVPVESELTLPSTSKLHTDSSPERALPQAKSTLHPLPSALATFPMHLAQLLTETLNEYLPNVREKSSRESLFTQVLYCAGSLGRLGGDFSMILSLLDTEVEEELDSVPEWEEAIRNHRILAERLDLLTTGASKDVNRAISPA